LSNWEFADFTLLTKPSSELFPLKLVIFDLLRFEVFDPVSDFDALD